MLSGLPRLILPIYHSICASIPFFKRRIALSKGSTTQTPQTTIAVVGPLTTWKLIPRETPMYQSDVKGGLLEFCFTFTARDTPLTVAWCPCISRTIYCCPRRIIRQTSVGQWQPGEGLDSRVRRWKRPGQDGVFFVKKIWYTNRRVVA